MKEEYLTIPELIAYFKREDAREISRLKGHLNFYDRLYLIYLIKNPKISDKAKEIKQALEEWLNELYSKYKTNTRTFNWN